MAPIEARKAELMKKKETFQFKRDVEDENLWIQEKMALASSQEVNIRIMLGGGGLLGKIIKGKGILWLMGRI